MSKGSRTNVLLVLALGALAVGAVFNTNLIDVRHIVGLYVVLPVGAVLFGLYLISRLLQNETESPSVQYRQEREVRAPLQSPDALPQDPKTRSPLWTP